MNILLKTLTITLGLFSGLQAMESDPDTSVDFTREITQKILKQGFKEVFSLAKTENTNFRESSINFASVCKGWLLYIQKNAKKRVLEYFNIPEDNQDVFWRFFKGKLIYKPNPDNDEGRIDLFISALPNPREGTFPLFQCKILDENGIEIGNAGQFLSISTGYPKKELEENDENDNKVKIWITDRRLVQEEIDNTARHLRLIFPSQWPESAPVGMFVTLVGGDNWRWYDYVKNVDGKSSLYENGGKPCYSPRPRYIDSDPNSPIDPYILPPISNRFQVWFGN